MTKEIQTLKTALAECKNQLTANPQFQPLQSIEKQLQYLLNIAEGKETDRSHLKEIVIGIYAAREFETRDVGFASLLYEVEEIVTLMK